MRLLALLLPLSLVGACSSFDRKLTEWRDGPATKEERIPADAVVAPPSQAHPLAKNVLVVINQASPQSVEIGSHYRKARGIPKENVVFVQLPTDDNLPKAKFESDLRDPVREVIEKSKTRIDYIVLTKGVPIRLENNGGFSVDGHLAAMNMAFRPIAELTPDDLKRAENPYYSKNAPFNSDTYGYYLVTRLDGYTTADAKRLVDNALLAEPKKGLFFFDKAANRRTGGYKDMQDTLDRAHAIMKEKGMETRLDDTETFVRPAEPLMGYASWGSNDRRFDAAAYKSLSFHPGAIGETFVSTSGRTFRPVTSGQSVITDLIAQGITGVKGYVSEPYTFALAKPDILFDRYTGGRNLAESFYAASQFLKWKDVVIGDPLCAPYAD